MCFYLVLQVQSVIGNAIKSNVTCLSVISIVIISKVVISKVNISIVIVSLVLQAMPKQVKRILFIVAKTKEPRKVQLTVLMLASLQIQGCKLCQCNVGLSVAVLAIKTINLNSLLPTSATVAILQLFGISPKICSLLLVN